MSAARVRLPKLFATIFLLCAGAAFAVLVASPTNAYVIDACTKYASPTGSDSASGSATAPYRTVQYLADHLGAGQTGCLSGGSYVGNLAVANSGITLVSVSGQRATLLGYVWIKNTANDVTLRDLNVDGYAVSPPPVQVNGDRVVLSNLDITDRNKAGTSYNGMCVLAGPNFEANPANVAYDLRIERSRIHNCGDDAHEHAIYLESTRNAVVTDSFLYDNPGYGIHMYPDAQGSVIEYTAIDGNSSRCKANVTFSGESAGGEYSQAHSSTNNVVRYSLITNALCRYNVESYYPSGTAGVGNVVENSCVWNAPMGNFGYTSGYTQRNNRDADPRYVDRANKNFGLQSTSPCLGYGPRSTGTAPPPTSTTSTTTTTSSTTTTSPPPPTSTTTTTTTTTTPTTTTTTPTPAPRPDFSVSLSPSSRSVVRGAGALFTLTVTPLNGLSAPVTFSVKGLPGGATSDFTPNPASSVATLLVETTPATKQGSYTLEITAVADGVTHTATARLQVTRK